ncbi:stage V sporulation protein AB [Paenibacillus endoradicis]|uniref:stage V sporulation protein AB n=1 Tax=Paenibacillus endoradicis TaxID=2972487 RepID=UPI0021592D91|nr:stage V sporulation protein AB [Paenibacillus endoradicis]MCR8660349.1 stage V sporulation protein AB [Paenibacillus endoradicis]
MIEFLQIGFIMFLALSGGVVVGTSFVALLVIFDLIPRLAQLTNSYHLSYLFEAALISGALYFTVTDFLNIQLNLPLPPLTSFIGLLDGMFVGMLAAALTEVMNVLPIIAKRLSLSRAMVALVMAMVIGKTVGSFFDWLVFQW